MLFPIKENLIICFKKKKEEGRNEGTNERTYSLQPEVQLHSERECGA